MHKKWSMLSICLVLSCLFVSHALAVESIVYKVKKGDTLWAISRINQISVNSLKKANGIKSNLIYPGDKLVIPRKSSDLMTFHKGIVLTKHDYDWFVKIIEAEAGGESLQGKVAVGSVVLNRVMHKQYPDTITDVIFQRVKHVYQFSPVADGRIYQVIPSSDSYKAAKMALKGMDPTEGALFFYNPTTARSKWIRTRVVIAEIGRHHFAY